MVAITILGLLVYIGVKRARATPVHQDSPCTSFTLPVSITAHQHIYDAVKVDNNLDAVHFAQDTDTWDDPSPVERVIKNITISREYDIHTTLCIPEHGAKRHFLQLATHGSAFDGRYWDAQIEPEKYSYVKATLEQGYSILYYDRIGTGKSSKPDAYTDVQLQAEVEILRAITEIVRSGKLSRYVSSTHWPKASISFDKIIHVGHSLGSVTTYGLTSLYPSLSDAAVLTGFLLNKEVFEQRDTARYLEYAAENDPKLFADFGSGYVVTSTKSGLNIGFFSARANTTTSMGGFEPRLLDYAFATRQPTGIVENLSLVTLYAENPTAPEFTGPVQFVVGEFDFVVCLGDCKGTYNTTMVDEMYPKAKNVDVHLQPGTGHALPFHHGARRGFEGTFDWLESNGF